ncbi:UNKNOWN [Stylonychia lemnae]|uniref:Uncharacterized protein n=1 Tax=Stylonychia lemnae TaxID=5949 RepID=A0A078A8V9_STYLE|nr:UNKNOWN [Stylonychia lemnae]|eukprot:CDW77238.1 UNKNOWN [Stylonychia lemnae]
MYRDSNNQTSPKFTLLQQSQGYLPAFNPTNKFSFMGNEINAQKQFSDADITMINDQKQSMKEKHSKTNYPFPIQQQQNYQSLPKHMKMTSMQMLNQSAMDHPRSTTNFIKKSSKINFSQSPLHSEKIFETKKLSHGFLNLENTNSKQLLLENQQIHQRHNDDANLLKQFKNIMYYQKHEQKKKDQLKEIKIRKSERSLESIEILFQQNPKNIEENVKRLLSFLDEQSVILIKNKNIQSIMSRCFINLSNFIFQMQSMFAGQIQVMNIEKKKMGVMLRKRLDEIQKYKNIEMLQEERLKNMFEHLRQLDLEIKEFSEDNEILNAKAYVHFGDKNMVEQQKNREKNQHNMKLLEFDLLNIQQQVSRDLELVLEKNDFDIQGMDSKFLSDQVKSGIQDSIGNLQKKIQTILLSNHTKAKNLKAEKWIQTESWDFAKFSENIDSLSRQNALLQKDMKWLQTKLDRSIAKEAEKDEKITQFMERIEKVKQQDLENRKITQDKEHTIREMKMAIQQKEREYQDLEHHLKDLESNIASKDQEFQKIESNLKMRLQQSFQNAYRQSRPSSKSPAIGRAATNTQGGHHDEVLNQDQIDKFFNRKKISIPGKQSIYLDDTESQGSHTNEDSHRRQNKSSFNKKRGASVNEKSQSSYGTQPNQVKNLQKMMKNAKVIQTALSGEFNTPQINKKKLSNHNLVKKISGSKVVGQIINKDPHLSTTTRNKIQNLSNNELIDRFDSQASEGLFQNQVIKSVHSNLLSPQMNRVQNGEGEFNFDEEEKEEDDEDESEKMMMNDSKRRYTGNNKHGQQIKISGASDDSVFEEARNHEYQQQMDEHQDRSQFKKQNRSMIENVFSKEDIDIIRESLKSEHLGLNDSDSKNQSERKIVALRVNQATGSGKSSMMTVMNDNNYKSNNNHIITEESNEQNQAEDKFVQTSQNFGIDQAIQAFDDESYNYDFKVIARYNHQSFGNHQSSLQKTQYPSQKIKVFKKLKINSRGNFSYNNSPRPKTLLQQEIQIRSLQDQKLNRSSEGINPPKQMEIISNTNLKSAAKFDNLQQHHLMLSSAANFQKIKLIKQRKATHIRSSSVKPDFNFEQTIIKGSRSPFKHNPNEQFI